MKQGETNMNQNIGVLLLERHRACLNWFKALMTKHGMTATESAVLHSFFTMLTPTEQFEHIKTALIKKESIK